MALPLPPLPDFGDGAHGRPAGRNVVDVVADDHRALVGLCAELTDVAVDGSRRRKVAQVVTAGLARHLSAEEQYLYPAVRAVVPGGDELAAREVAEDHAILITLRDLSSAADDTEFDRHAAAVAVQVRRHAESAAAELLPLLLQVAPVEDLVRLGSRVETAAGAAPTRPHPGTPAAPPWNKVVDPAVGMLDKMRDAVTGRITYTRDL
jgi:hypothetical protein